jgi:hypothetical protein
LENGRRHGRPATRAKVADALGQMVAEHLRDENTNREPVAV